MKNLHTYFLTIILSFFSLGQLSAQHLQPGFDAAEYADLLNLEYDLLKPSQTIVTPYYSYQYLDESPEVGLFNKCCFWLRNDNVVVVCVRGTIGKTESWLENFYSAMIPAIGQLQLNDSTQFHYQLATNEKAYVHVGWTLGLAHLAPYILKKPKPFIS